MDLAPSWRPGGGELAYRPTWPRSGWCDEPARADLFDVGWGVLGTEASEEQAKSVGKSARILHFTTDGHFDERFPLNSYLALSRPVLDRELRHQAGEDVLDWEGA